MHITFHNHSIKYTYMFMMLYPSTDSYKPKISLDDKTTNTTESSAEIPRLKRQNNARH